MQEENTAAQAALIDLRDVRKEYRDIQGEVLTVLNLAALQIAAGEIVALTGKSGSGKTTLINIVAGILAPTQGKVLVNGQAIYDLSEAGRDLFRAQNIGYVFQSYNLMPSLSRLLNLPFSKWPKAASLPRQMTMTSMSTRTAKVTKGTKQKTSPLFWARKWPKKQVSNWGTPSSPPMAWPTTAQRASSTSTPWKWWASCSP